MSKFKIVDDITIQPNHDFVLVKVDSADDEELTSGGIIIPHGVIQNKKTGTGTVVAVGQGRRDTSSGKILPMSADVGQRVIFAAFIGYPISLGTKGLHIMIKDYDLMGIVCERAHYVDDPVATDYEHDSDKIVVT